MTLRSLIGSACGIAGPDAYTVAQRLAAGLALLLAAPLPAQAAWLRLDWSLDFSYPPNPCVAGSSLVSHGLGLFAATEGDGERLPLGPEPGLPVLSCGASGGGVAVFDSDDGTSIFAAYGGAVRFPTSGPPEQPVYAFPFGTADGDLLVESNPGAAPVVPLGAVCGDLFCPGPGSPALPLFAFASPGAQIGTLRVVITAMPEPATWTLLMLAGGAWWAGGRRRPARGRTRQRDDPAAASTTR